MRCPECRSYDLEEKEHTVDYDETSYTVYKCAECGCEFAVYETISIISKGE